MKILVVDDDLEVLRATSRFLLDSGFEVCKALGGKDGLKTFDMRGPFDCVLTDYQMPDLDGIHLAFEIRKLEPTQRIVINTMSYSLAGCMKDYGLADIPVVNKQEGIEAIVKILRTQ